MIDRTESRQRHHIPEPALRELRFRLRGGLHAPGDHEYADACTLFSSMIERRPRLVASCAGATT